MAAFPKNYLSVPKHARKVIEFFAGRLDAPCYIVGNGPSVSEVCLSYIELQNSTVFRANWFFLEEEKRFGDRVDGFFWSVENKGLREAIEDIQARNEYTINDFFQPFRSSDAKDRLVINTVNSFLPNLDHLRSKKRI